MTVVLDCPDISVEFLIVGIQLVYVLLLLAKDAMGKFYLRKRLKHFNLLFYLTLLVKDVVGHVGKAKVMGNVRVEIVGKFLDLLGVPATLDFQH